MSESDKGEIKINPDTYKPPELPLVLPIKSEKITGADDGFGDARGNRPHLATDIYAIEGTEIRSATSIPGTVVATGGKETVTKEQRDVYNKWTKNGRKGEAPDMDYSSGKYATVRYISNEGVIFYVTYWHLSSINVKEGDNVKPDETVIGNVGKTGTTVSHLHMAVYMSMKNEGVLYYGYVNPINYLKDELENAGIAPKYKCKLCEQGKWSPELDRTIYWYDENTGRIPPKNLGIHLKKIRVEPPDQTKVIRIKMTENRSYLSKLDQNIKPNLEMNKKKEEQEKRKLAIV